MCYLKFIHQHNLTRFSSSFVFRGYYFLFLSLTLIVVFVCVCMCLRVITLQVNRPLKFIQSSVVGGGACELSTVLRCAQSLGRVRFFMTLWTVACQPPLCMGFSSKNTGVGCRAILQGIFPIQGSNPGLLHCIRILYRLSVCIQQLVKLLIWRRKWQPTPVLLHGKSHFSVSAALWEHTAGWQNHTCSAFLGEAM